MTPYEIEKTVLASLTAYWSATPIRRINKNDPSVVPFIECYFKPGLMENIEIGGAGVRNGIFIINIYTPKGSGVQQGNYYGGILESFFWHKRIEDVVCENDTILPYTQFVGIDDDLQACHHKTIIPFSVITEM